MNVGMDHYSNVLCLGILFYAHLPGGNAFDRPFKIIMFFIVMPL